MVSRRKLSIFGILLAVALMFCLLQLGGMAYGDSGITALKVTTVADDDSNQALGGIKVTVPAGVLALNDSIIVKLPSNYKFVAGSTTTGTARATHADGNNDVVLPGSVSGDPNGISLAGPASAFADITVAARGDDQLQLTLNTVAHIQDGYDVVFYVYLDDILVESGAEDAIVNFDGPEGTGFPRGDVTVATVAGTGQVVLSASGADTSNSDFDVVARAKESTKGSLKLGSKSLQFKLPSGYVWDMVSVNNAHVESIWGEDISVNIKVDDETLTLDFNGIDTNGDGVADEVRATNTASCWEVTLNFIVDDDSECTPGSIMVAISGKSDTNTSSAPLGTYGDIGATVKAEDAPTVIAGQTEQEIGDITITESLKASLVEGRTVTLTLPDGCKWQPVYEAETDGDSSTNPKDAEFALDDFDSDASLRLEFNQYTGSDYRTARFKVDHESTKAAEITLKDCEIAIEAGFTGDVTVTVAGTAGLSGEVVVAKAIAPITVTAASTPNVSIGLNAQDAGEVTITEAQAGAFNTDVSRQVILGLPTDVEFDAVPDVEVTDGDLKIENVQKNGSVVTFNVSRESTTASTITVSGIKLKLYRTVPEGNIGLKVKGEAIVQTSKHDDWSTSTSAGSATIAVCATPAPVETKVNASLVIGSTTMKVNGADVTMDVAPYIKDGRTYVPVRFVAQALGVAPENILWDNGVVTLLKDNKVIQMTIGSQALLLSGISIPMDVAPEINNGRTMLPFRWVAQAMGATVNWDEATQTVTMDL